MNYISTSGLRTQSTDLINALLSGRSVDLLHRSKLVGRIVPVEANKKKKRNFVDVVKSLPRSKPMTAKQIDKAYREAMVKKHGKRISGC